MRELRILKGYSGGNISFSPDGKTIASASEDRTVKLWSVEGTELQSLKGHSSKVTSVSFSPDGKTIASASEDRTVKLWSIEGTELHSPKEQSGGVTSVCFSPDGKTITFVSGDGTVKRWSIESRKFLLIPQGEEGVIPEGEGHLLISVSFSPDGKTIAFASEDQTVKLWSEGNRPLIGNQSIPIGREDDGNHTSRRYLPFGGVISQSRERVLVFGGTTRVWTREGTYSKLPDLKGHSGAVTSVSFSPDGKTIASASEDKTVKLWSIEGRELHTLKGHTGAVTSVSFSPDGKTIASASIDGTIILWNFDLEDLLVRGCDWLRDQNTNPNVTKSDQNLCEYIGTQK